MTKKLKLGLGACDHHKWLLHIEPKLMSCFTHNRYVIQRDPKGGGSLRQQFVDTLGHHLPLGDQLTGIKLSLHEKIKILASKTTN
jgi:hypothetical protein